MRNYLTTFLHFNSSAIRRAVALNFAAAFTEGIGLMLLLPLLSLAGVLEQSGTGGASQGWTAKIGEYVSSTGIAWNIETALLVFVALIFLQSQLALHRDRVANALQLRFGDHLRKELYAAITRARWSFLTGKHSAELLNTLGTEVQRIGSGTYFLIRFFTVAVMSLVYISVALWLSAWLTVLALATGLALWLLLRGADAAAKQSGAMLSRTSRKMVGQIQEFLSAMKLVKIHGEEAASLRRFNREVDDVSLHHIEYQHVYTRVQAVYRVGGAVALAVVSYAALVWIKLPAAHLLVLIAIFARMLPQLAQLQSGRQQLLHMLPAFASWRRLMDECAAHVDPVLSHGDAVPLLRGIAFEQVSFSHPQSHHTLRVAQLAIPANKTTAIAGVSGSGKTTLLDLTSGLLSPDSGAILIDGAPLPSGWRQSIAYIPQETHIQNGTIRENLSWGNAASSDEQVARALTQSALDEFIKRLPRGLDTEVGERGVKLSGGEKQRLALARALLRRPQLLILDEATSALDADNHRLVLDAIRALHGSMTVLIVTHRHEELAGLIDGLVRVENGEVGAWQEVMGT
ncbi:MAG: ABC transporter ATP-binding protein/permease [Gallionella sp.]|nr:ABC transporter ATP-binding protein/permease [Gallionella sp.]